MPVRSIVQWKLLLMLLSEATVWNATDYLLQDLLNYSRQEGMQDGTFDDDHRQAENFLSAWRSISTAKVLTRSSFGPVPVVDVAIREWKTVLSNLSVNMAAEVILSNYLFDPEADYSYCVKVLSRAMTAWAELQTTSHKATVLPLQRR